MGCTVTIDVKTQFFLVISVRVVGNIPITMIVVILNVSHYTLVAFVRTLLILKQ